MVKTVDEARLVAVLEARITKYERDLQKATRTTDRNMRSIEKRGKQMESQLRQSMRGAAQSATLLHGPLSGIASRVTTLASIVGSANPGMVALGVSTAALTLAASRAVTEFAKFEVQQKTIEQILIATGQASGRTADDIETLAQEIARATLASTGEIREAAQILLTFRSISGEVFNETLRLTQDLAQVGFGTAKTAALQLGKALEDPKNGLTALRRVGVSFTEAQKQVINGLFETGRTAEAQKVLLKALAQQVGGAGAAASNNSLAGAYDSLSQSTQNLLVTWGEQITKGLRLTGVINGLAEALENANQAYGGGTLKQQIEFLDKAIEAKRKTGAVGGLVRDLVNTFALNPSGLADLDQLIAKRERLIALLEKEQSSAASAAERERIAAARERAEGVVKALEKELVLAGKTNVEKRKAAELARAGVTAESDLGQQIIRNLEAIAAAEKRLKDSNKRTPSSFARTERSLLERIQSLDAESRALLAVNPLIEDYGAKTEFAAAKQRLLNAAARDGRAITPELAAGIDTLAKSYAVASANLKRIEAEQQKVREAMEQWKSTTEDVLSTFIKDLRSGVSASEALQKGLLRISDVLIDMAVKNLVANAIGGLGGFGGFGGGGGFATIFPGIFHAGGLVGKDGGGSGRAVSSAVFAGAPRYHSGGVAGLKPGEVPAILQKGEVVIPNGATSRSASGGQIMITVSPSDMLYAEIDNRADGAVARSAPAIVGSAVQATDKALPAMISKYQKRRG